jgi:hypothetical protein
MNSKLWTRIILVAVIAIAGFGFKDCDKSYPVSEMAKQAARSTNVFTSERSRQVTNGGTVLLSYKAWPQSTLDAIDAGLNDRWADFVADGFKEELKKPGSFWEIRTPAVPCVDSPVQHIKSFMVGGSDFYDGTEYDQYNSKGPEAHPYRAENGNMIYFVRDGKSAVFAAEMVLSFGTPGSTYQTGIMIACPDDSVIHDAVANGEDHIGLANWPYHELYRVRGPYDGWQYFNETLQHVTGRGHPLEPRNAPEEVASSKLKVEGPKPSIVTETPIDEDLRQEAISRGLPTESVVTVASSTAIIRAVR